MLPEPIILCIIGMMGKSKSVLSIVCHDCHNRDHYIDSDQGDYILYPLNLLFSHLFHLLCLLGTNYCGSDQDPSSGQSSAFSPYPIIFISKNIGIRIVLTIKDWDKNNTQQNTVAEGWQTRKQKLVQICINSLIYVR